MAISLDDFDADAFGFPSLNDFRVWLEAIGTDRGPFQDWGWFGCPVWHFLQSLGFKQPTVYRNGEWLPNPQVEYVEGYEMANWAREFVWLCDLYKPRTMTPADCLSLIDNPLFRPDYWANKTRIPIRRLED